MLAPAVLLAAFATAVVAAPPPQEYPRVNINQYVDSVIEKLQLQAILEYTGLNEVELKDTSLLLATGEAEARNMTLRGLASLHRSGDCFLELEEDEGRLDLQLGWGPLELTTAALKLPTLQRPVSANFSLRGASLRVLALFVNDPSGYGLGFLVHLDRLEFVTLGSEVIVSSEDKDYDGKDEAGLFREFVLSHVNYQLKRVKDKFNTHPDYKKDPLNKFLKALQQIFPSWKPPKF